jgi:hypothetical protein
MSTQTLQAIASLLNTTLSAIIATIAGSFLLYSLSRDIRNRVMLTYSALLFFVTVTYIGDLGVSYSDSLATAARWLRFQWLGIAFVPAVYVHLSSEILGMTGAASPGRRRVLVWLLYVMALLFLILVVGGSLLVRDPVPDPAPHFQAGPLFWVFVAYFVGAVTLSMTFLVRARSRALIQSTRRRMTYLLVPYLAPGLAVFPFLLVATPSLQSPPIFYIALILMDGVLAVMLTFMSYPLAFFGTWLPDRVVKAQMLQFFLRGPVVAIAALGVILAVPRAGAFLGLPGDEVMPFLTVIVILLLQWVITWIRPGLERLLIYGGDQGEIRHIQEMEVRLLTGTDFRQLLETILAATCDFLRVDNAFIASLAENGPKVEQTIGLHDGFSEEISQFTPDELTSRLTVGGEVFEWEGFWLIPLRVGDGGPRLVGVMGIAAPMQDIQPETWEVLMALAGRAAEVLEDHRLQSEVFGALEDLLPEMATSQWVRGAARTGDRAALAGEPPAVPPDFAQRVKDALAHYWGGPKLTDQVLMRLSVVRRALDENDGNPQRAMRAVLQEAIERQRPEGQRSMTTTEWIFYNILEMRFIQGRKVRDVAMRLAMSESDLYRKQRGAIEAVAQAILDMESATAAEEAAGSVHEGVL